MPETVDSQRTAYAIAQAALLQRGLETQCRTYQPDQQASGPGYQRQKELLAQRKGGRVALIPGLIFSGLVPVCAAHISPWPSESIS